MTERSKRERGLRRLAALYGFQAGFRDVFGARQRADAEVLEALLAARGVAARDAAAIEKAALEREQSEARRTLQPVHAARSGRRAPIEVHAGKRWSSADLRIEMETGDAVEWSARLDALEDHGDFRSCGVDRTVKRITLPALEPGYHQLSMTAGGETATALLIVHPPHAWGRLSGEAGLFAPLYAVRATADWGVGDFGELERMMDWARSRGLSVVGTLPLHPSFCGAPSGGTTGFFDPSPYSPVSRLFLNELFVDLDAAAEEGGEPARAAIESLRRERPAAESDRLVDYREVARRKLSGLSRLAGVFQAAGSPLRADLEAFLAANPETLEYAAFRAAVDSRGAPPAGWISSEDRSAAAAWEVGQWLASRQLSRLAARAGESGARLYLDFPLGSSPDGYDLWKYRQLFLPEVSAGAPPDHSYRTGQNWGFRPFDPDRLREEGYGFFRRAISAQMRFAGILRIDHVMGLHRLYCVPAGFSPSRGAYLRYPARELYAILTLESHRHRCSVIGEDLGTVPRYVREAIDGSGLNRLFVLQRQLTHVADPPGEIAPNMVASLNNHDIAAFASFWRGLDLADRADLGIYDEASLEREVAKRATAKSRWLSLLLHERLLAPEECEDAEAIVAASELFLARSAAGLVLLNIEDLWLECLPQNTPTTTFARPNWRRRLALTLEEIEASETIAKRVNAVVRR